MQYDGKDFDIFVSGMNEFLNYHFPVLYCQNQSWIMFSKVKFQDKLISSSNFY